MTELPNICQTRRRLFSIFSLEFYSNVPPPDLFLLSGLPSLLTRRHNLCIRYATLKLNSKTSSLGTVNTK
jgi:hypothetical protein